MATDFEIARDRFPIKSQANLDDAVARLRNFIANPPGGTSAHDVQRARAWLGYALVTAAIDFWEFTQLGVANATDRLLPAHVRNMLQAGWTAAKTALDNTPDTSPWLYDVRWAMAFAYLYWDPPAGPTQILDRELKHRFAKVLYAKAVTASLAANDPDPALYAEIADGLVYLGEVGTALRLINRAIKAAQNAGKVPAWYWWVKGWVHFNAAALEADEERSDNHYDKAVRSIRRMFKLNATNDGEDPPEHFDALLVLAVASLEIGEPVAAARYAALFAALVQQKKVLPGWDFRREMARHPFDPFDEDAQALERHLRRAAKTLFP